VDETSYGTLPQDKDFERILNLSNDLIQCIEREASGNKEQQVIFMAHA
jgi:hypothetical protein